MIDYQPEITAVIKVKQHISDNIGPLFITVVGFIVMSCISLVIYILMDIAASSKDNATSSKNNGVKIEELKEAYIRKDIKDNQQDADINDLKMWYRTHEEEKTNFFKDYDLKKK